MPSVNGKKFPYTKKGEEKAKEVAKKEGAEVKVMPMKQRIMEQMKKKMGR